MPKPDSRPASFAQASPTTLDALTNCGLSAEERENLKLSLQGESPTDETLLGMRNATLARLAHQTWEKKGTLLVNGVPLAGDSLAPLEPLLRAEIERLRVRNSSLLQIGPKIELLTRLNEFVAQQEVINALWGEWGAACREARSTNATFVREVAPQHFSSLPAGIRNLRVAQITDSEGGRLERHPASDQYLYCMLGAGETLVKLRSGWRVDRYADWGGDLSNSWHFVQANALHASRMRGNERLVLLAFHTVSPVVDEYEDV